ncbi:unnamed protein product [Schistocephalus solidus]|uniref:Choline O-acetyltransferase n=1 Tax=Schistocephalus solidus TaxID=70667 RepID=A0A183SS46_SCHSO|nr:unnamed protein product [Schistocephalus solidus]
MIEPSIEVTGIEAEEMAHNVREFVRRISSHDLDQYPDWDLTKPLPRLPVPDLRTTLNRYLGVVAPIVDEEAFKHTRQLVNEFARSGGEGEELQAALQAHAKTLINWATPWWLVDMYLKNPLPLPVNSNPGMVFPRHHFISARQQLRFAAQLLSGILDYKTILDTRSLPIDRVSHNRKGQPLCMEQYYRLFTSYRYPGIKRDDTVTKDMSELAESAHAIVVCNDQVGYRAILSTQISSRTRTYKRAARTWFSLFLLITTSERRHGMHEREQLKKCSPIFHTAVWVVRHSNL